MTAFLACWFPFFLLNIIYALDSSIRIDPETILIAKWLHYLNSLLNPVIYSCMNRDFRAAFKRLATRFFGRISGNANQLDRNLGTSRGMSLSGTQTKGPSYKQKSVREEAVWIFHSNRWKKILCSCCLCHSWSFSTARDQKDTKNTTSNLLRICITCMAINKLLLIYKQHSIRGSKGVLEYLVKWFWLNTMLLKEILAYWICNTFVCIVSNFFKAIAYQPFLW